MCQSCEALTINGVLCHEHGCPDAWIGRTLECPECGSEFIPESHEQRFCSQDCAAAYAGFASDFSVLDFE